MDKIKTLNFYIGGDAGCVDVAEAKLTGYTLVPDKDLKRLEDENERLKLLSCAKSIAENNNQQTKHKGFDKIVWTAGLHAIYKNTTYFIHSVDLDEGLIGLRNMYSNDDPFWVRFENAEIIQ